VVPRDAVDRTLVDVSWREQEAWCSDTVHVVCKFDRPGAPTSGMVSIVDSVDGAVLTGDRHELGSGTEYAVPLVVHSVLPREIGDGKESARALTAVVDSVRSMPESSLSLRFLHQLPRLRFERGLAHFDVWVEDHNVKVGGTIKFKRG